jgi:hypothetical protein
LDFGGGLLANAPNAAIYSCAFHGNIADVGGGIDAGFAGGPAFLANCLFSGNRADAGQNGAGGGLNLSGANVHQLANCTFADNIATVKGHAINVDSPGADVVNSIVWFHPKPAISHGPDSALAIRYSDVESGWPGEGNIEANPLFVDRIGDDGLLGTGDENLRLTVSNAEYSPAIDAGNTLLLLPDVADLDEDFDFAEPTPKDLDRWFRVMNAAGVPETGIGDPPVDMGAYEVRCDGDLDGDNDVDQSDLGIMLAGFGCEWPPCSADLDGDGDADQGDLGIVLSHFGQVCR